MNHRPFEACDYIEIDGKKFLYLNDDSPVNAYHNCDISFVAQPLLDSDGNKKHKVISVPLMMTDEWNIIKQQGDNLLGKLRTTEKTYDYNFIGQCHYVGREVFRELTLDNYYFLENPRGIYGLNREQKDKELVDFLFKIANSKFIFCPRGVGSSSFRLYQSFMVGSVPIVTGMKDYPFSDEVDWDDMCVRGDLDDIDGLIEKSKTVDYEKLRENGMKFWDEYCRHDKLYEKLKKVVS